MKHIKLFEDYTDDELKNLMGDLHGIGHSKVVFNADLSKSIGQKEQKNECENWVSEKNPEVHVTKVEGHIISIDKEDINLKINLSNGDYFEFDFGDSKYDNGYEGKMTILTGGKKIEKNLGDEMFEYPGGWILTPLILYDELI